jgi:hypothetical protein
MQISPVTPAFAGPSAVKTATRSPGIALPIGTVSPAFGAAVTV